MVLTNEQIADKLSAVQGWSLEGEKLVKTYRFSNFETPLKLVNTVAIVAENLDHHPEICFGFGYATFSLSTHSEGGVTDKDLALAKEIEKSVAVILE